MRKNNVFKPSKMKKRIKTNSPFNILCLTLAVLTACLALGGCAEYPAYRITNPPFVNKTSLTLYTGDREQLTASPEGGDFVWTSDNPAIAAVSDSGLVTALAEGIATISVASHNDHTNVDVRVKTFIHISDISLSKTAATVLVGNSAQITASPLPENASEVAFVWTSDNPAVATVDKRGLITAHTAGVATITVSSDTVKRHIAVTVPELYRCPKTGWTVEVSDETASDGGGKNKIIDDSYNGKEFWHSKWDGGAAPLPHWAVIDMKTAVTVARVTTLRRNNGDAKTLQYFVGNDPDPNSKTWTKITEGAYASKTADHSLQLDASEPASGRYLKLVMPDSYRQPFIGICEIDVYGVKIKN
jgi:hypothetical protein